MKYNHPDIYERWVKVYGHYEGRRKYVAKKPVKKTDIPKDKSKKLPPWLEKKQKSKGKAATMPMKKKGC